MVKKSKLPHGKPPEPDADVVAFLLRIDTYAKAMQEIRGWQLRLQGPWIQPQRTGWPGPEEDADHSDIAQVAWLLAKKFGFTAKLSPPPTGPMSSHHAGDYVERVQAAFEDRSRKEHWKERTEIAHRLGKTFLRKLVEDSSWEIRRHGVGSNSEMAVKFLRLLLSEVSAYDRVWARPYGITIFWDAASHARRALLEFLPTLAVPAVPEGSVTISELRSYLKLLLHLADGENARAAKARGGRHTARLSDGRRNCLVALLDVKAFDRDTRQASPEIARRAAGGYSTSWTKQVLRHLVLANEVESLPGIKGGYWLTQTGRVAAEQIASA
jgi:hypothetical protein